MHTNVEVIPAYIWEIAKSLTNSIIKDRLFSISEQETGDGYRVSGSIRFMVTEKKYNEIMGSHGGQG